MGLKNVILLMSIANAKIQTTYNVLKMTIVSRLFKIVTIIMSKQVTKNAMVRI